MGHVETDKFADKCGAVVILDCTGTKRKPRVKQKLVGGALSEGLPQFPKRAAPYFRSVDHCGADFGSHFGELALPGQIPLGCVFGRTWIPDKTARKIPGQAGL